MKLDSKKYPILSSIVKADKADIKVDPKSIEWAIKKFISENKEPHPEEDWWGYDEKGGVDFNIHNYGSSNVDRFKVDVYPHAEGQNKPDHTVWKTVKTFKFSDYKKYKKKTKLKWKEIDPGAWLAEYGDHECVIRKERNKFGYEIFEGEASNDNDPSDAGFEASLEKAKQVCEDYFDYD